MNITDAHYFGDRSGHPCDIAEVVRRGQAAGVRQVFLGTDFRSSAECAVLAKAFGEFSAAGIHPLSASKASQRDIAGVAQIVQKRDVEECAWLLRPKVAALAKAPCDITGALVAVGEVGLDYYRGAETKAQQKRVFAQMLELAVAARLPCIFHSRECATDFLEITADYKVQGVVHSFTGTAEEMKELLKRGYYIGLNGLSLKESESTGVVDEVPLDRLLLETDAPYCGVKKTLQRYSSAQEYLAPKRRWGAETGAKGRNEPVNVHQVLDIIAAARSVSKEELVKATDSNFRALFGLDGLN